MEWEKAYPGARKYQPRYGIIVHGVKREDVPATSDNTSTMEEWEEVNDIKIVKITPLRRHEKATPSPHKSIVIFTEEQDTANECLRRGFVIGNIIHKTERYAPHLHVTRCYKCHYYGHKAHQCRKQSRCARCGKNHDKAQCTEDKPTCVNCKGDHEAWESQCPIKSEEGRRLAQLRMDLSPFFA